MEETEIKEKLKDLYMELNSYKELFDTLEGFIAACQSDIEYYKEILNRISK